MQNSNILGIDVGASGIKGAIIDIKTGRLLTDRLRLLTPQPSKPEAVAQTFKDMVEAFKWSGLVGCGFPTLVREGVSISASNLDKSWVGKNVETVLSLASNCTVKVLNDADAAGMAEMKFSAGSDAHGTIIFITIGTGLGSALFVDGKMVPNTEFGQLYLKGQENIAEQYASSSAKDRDKLSWEEWGKRFDEYLNHLELLFSPTLFLLGGGTSKDFDQYAHFFTGATPVKPAKLQNHAGMIGAACYAYESMQQIERSSDQVTWWKIIQ